MPQVILNVLCRWPIFSKYYLHHTVHTEMSQDIMIFLFLISLTLLYLHVRIPETKKYAYVARKS